VERTSWTWNGVRGHVDGLNETDYNTHPVILDAVFQRSAGLCSIGSGVARVQTRTSIYPTRSRGRLSLACMEDKEIRTMENIQAAYSRRLPQIRLMSTGCIDKTKTPD